MFLCIKTPYAKYQLLNRSSYLTINIWIWNRHSTKAKFVVASRRMIGSYYVDTLLLYSVVIFGFFTSRIPHSRLHAVNLCLPHHNLQASLYFRYDFDCFYVILFLGQVPYWKLTSGTSLFSLFYKESKNVKIYRVFHLKKLNPKLLLGNRVSYKKYIWSAK